MSPPNRRILRIVISAVVAFGIIPAAGHGDIHLLISKLDKEIAANPSDTGKLLKRAILHCQHGSHDEALADLEVVKELDPKRPERHYVTARVYMSQEKWKLAKAELDQHLLALPRQSDSYFLRSQVHLKNGKPDEAVEDMNQVIGLLSPAPLKYYLHLIRIQSQRGQIDEAIIVCEQARKSLGDLPNIMIVQAQLLRDGDRLEEASRIYSLIRQETPGLAFKMSLEEARMWTETDNQKALRLLDQAEAIWNNFPERKRALEPMQDLHKELNETKQLILKN